MTPLMRADDIADSFNATTERKHWRAVVGGTKALPTVCFNSSSSMVRLTYYPTAGVFAVAFNKATCAYGDFMASTYNSLTMIALALKAAGHEFLAPVDNTDGRLRVEFDPKTKQTYVTLASTSDEWTPYDTVSFKAD
jgi:hypothetical protein